MRCFLVVVLLLVLVTAVPRNLATPRSTSPELNRKLTGVGGGSVQAVNDLLQRVLGSVAAQHFSLSLQPLNDPETGTVQATDAFQINPSVPNSQVIQITGNSGVALATGVMYYLRNYANLSISWGYETEDGWSCDNLNFPKLFPEPTQTEMVVSPYLYRYYENVCTVSYSMAWWDWRRWEREIDWMALSGINLPLAFGGQEWIWTKVYKTLGLTDDELNQFYSGPAFLAWQRMGNIQGWGGPLTEKWQSQQATLQKQIVARMRALGIIPVLSAFAGHVPSGLKRLFPNASIAPSSPWGQFNTSYTPVDILDASDDLFVTIGSMFLSEQAKEFGFGEHIYQCDTFNEMDPTSTDLDYLKNYSRSVYRAMAAFDPDAVWLMQDWLFHSGYWTPERIAAYLSGVEKEQLLILDLNSEQGPFWDQLVKNDKRFLWCMLHNYGGERDLHGNIDAIASNPITARNAAGDLMVGTGITMEAIEQNPVMYELMNEMGWRSQLFDATDWLHSYANTRYGGNFPNAISAWNVLKKASYSREFSWEGQWIGGKRPDLNMGYDTSQDPTGVAQAFRLFTFSAFDSGNSRIGGWSYDMVDIGRQFLSNTFFDLYQSLLAVLQSCPTPPSGAPVTTCSSGTWADCETRVLALKRAMLGIFDDMEALLSCDVNYLLGHWIESARQWGDTDDEKNALEFNARNQITLWGPNGEINDYASKAWSGLVGTYHRSRWELFLNTTLKAISLGKHIDLSKYYEEVIQLGRDWCNDTTPFPTQPSGPPAPVAQRIVDSYSSLDGYSKVPQTTLASVIRIAWTRDVSTLARLCDADPSCSAFTTDGLLGCGETSQSKTSTTYVKN
eukprot:c25466_g1_i1.p1 GENE.c25466_g1_i1~~c25466_g1_i1.p1  ORF type:complete len:842 (-),score=191.56 c25466_g1_i1:50-2575(-)